MIMNKLMLDGKAYSEMPRYLCFGWLKNKNSRNGEKNDSTKDTDNDADEMMITGKDKTRRIIYGFRVEFHFIRHDTTRHTIWVMTYYKFAQQDKQELNWAEWARGVMDARCVWWWRDC